MPLPAIDTVVFDLGGVLVDWNPRYLYRKLFQEEVAMEDFLTRVCHGSWNEMHDAGRPFREGIAETVAKHPEFEPMIRAYFDRWPEMMAGEVPGTSKVLAEIRSAGAHRIYALSNWSNETFPHALKRFEFFRHFDSILLSGNEKMIKPDPRFYGLLTERFQVQPERAIFIDDVEKNIVAAKNLGFHVHRFTDSLTLRQALTDLGILRKK